MQIVAAKLPLDLEVVKFGLRRRLKRNEDSKWRGYEYRWMANRTIADIRMFNEKIEDEADREWQLRWDSETRAEITHSFIRDVKMGRNDWFKPTRRTVFVLTGHGPFREPLCRRGIVATDSCPFCNASESIEHVLFDCPAYSIQRYEYLNDKRNDWRELLLDRERFKKFDAFINEIQ